ncbi:MarR family transcriptional regulator [Rhodococcus sp. PAMC28707]|uniref:MarR family winged helix-turn-helix transcriptional regulator n=1 Tax=unclassified Rhodococcus (in: high G+C Gram-positive bacteria) TaxID=192944 RepID=UPI00109E341B|nr:MULTISPECIES: MarR family transcriptional regulator [unclassified Rhodococcus (in: high G+C Gram-positive bacteria)]QCB50052.1 MarR family transcriptional regulator [Rhodococcus sp. PAMC28705]QCB58253.1 MarR family transcriptional regulator [Rhodococcus sp. PAMC28707]
MNAPDVWSDLRKLVLEVSDPHRAVVAATGESFFRTKVLRQLLHGPLSAGELAEQLGSDPPYLSIALRDLEARGHLERTEDPLDRRRRVVALTDSGRELARVANEVLRTPPAALTALSEAELAILARILSSLLGDSVTSA